jgi:hypothetical protein
MLSRRLDNSDSISDITADVTTINGTLAAATALATPNTLMKRDANNKTAVGTLETEAVIAPSGTLALSGTDGVKIGTTPWVPLTLTDPDESKLDISPANGLVYTDSAGVTQGIIQFNGNMLYLSAPRVAIGAPPLLEWDIVNKGYVDTVIAEAGTGDVEATADTLAKRLGDGSLKANTIWANRIRSADNLFTQLEATDTNTRCGKGAGSSLTTGTSNSLFGINAGLAIKAGANNTAVGWNCMGYGGNLASGSNTGVGSQAAANINGGASSNTCVGTSSGYSIVGGGNNTSLGYNSLGKWTVDGGAFNRITAIGVGSLFANKADDVVGIGYNAGASADDAAAIQNFYLGTNSGYANRAGARNIYIGHNAGFYSNPGLGTGQNVLIGDLVGGSLTTATQTTFVGASADGAAGVINGTAIGYGASVTSNNTIQLGNASVTDVKTSGAITSTSSINGSSLNASGYITAQTAVYCANVKFNPVTCTPLSYYEEYDFVATFQGGITPSVSTTLKVVRVNNRVTITSPVQISGTGVSGNSIFSDDVLPDRFWSVGMSPNVNALIKVVNNSNPAMGEVRLNSGSLSVGLFSVSGSSMTNSNDWTNFSGWMPWSFTYDII